MVGKQAPGPRAAWTSRQGAGVRNLLRKLQVTDSDTEAFCLRDGFVCPSRGCVRGPHVPRGGDHTAQRPAMTLSFPLKRLQVDFLTVFCGWMSVLATRTDAPQGVLHGGQWCRSFLRPPDSMAAPLAWIPGRPQGGRPAPASPARRSGGGECPVGWAGLPATLPPSAARVRLSVHHCLEPLPRSASSGWTLVPATLAPLPLPFPREWAPHPRGLTSQPCGFCTPAGRQAVGSSRVQQDGRPRAPSLHPLLLPTGRRDSSARAHLQRVRPVVPPALIP